MLGQRGPLCFPNVGGWAVRPIERRGEVRQRILARQWWAYPRHPHRAVRGLYRRVYSAQNRGSVRYR